MSDQVPTSAPQRISLRFGDEILQAGFTSVPNLVLKTYRKLNITFQEMMFIIHVWQYWWTEKNPYPSLPEIAKQMMLTRRQAQKYVASLKEKGYLLTRERTDSRLGQTTNEYDFEPLIQAVLRAAKNSPPQNNPSRGGVNDSSRAPVNNPSTEEYVDQEDPVQEDERYISNGKATLRDRLKQSESDPAPQRQSRGVTRIGEALAEAPARFSRAREKQQELPANVPPTIALYVTSWSRELHDSEHVKSNITQAFRLMQQTGLSESVFLQKMTEARAITKERGNIKKPASEYGEFGTKNKVPYWFAVLRDLLGLKEEDTSQNHRYSSS